MAEETKAYEERTRDIIKVNQLIAIVGISLTHDQTMQTFMDLLGEDCGQWPIFQILVFNQTNFDDCGIYTMQWIKHLAFKVNIPKWCDYDCADFRIMISLEIEDGQLRWEDAYGKKLVQ